MDILEVHKKIEIVKKILEEISGITSIVTAKKLGIGESNKPEYEGTENMASKFPKKDKQTKNLWKDLQGNIPSGFSLSGNLMRHLHFNQSRDWYDIWSHDIPTVLEKINEYEKQLALVEYLNTLHPQIKRVSGIVLSGDIDAALKTVYSSLDSRIRSFLKLKSSENTVPSIGRAFKDGVLASPLTENNDAARNFLQGVIGYYRSNIVHKPLPSSRNNISASLPLFGLADESFKLFEECIKADDIPY